MGVLITPLYFYLLMMKQKLKILMCSEASFINSGFGIYTKELLNRLYDTNKYDIAEFASYGFVNDPRDVSIRWKYYANAVKDTDPRHNFKSMPRIRSERPAFDLHYPHMAAKADH